jgi:hypothetical protein
MNNGVAHNNQINLIKRFRYSDGLFKHKLYSRMSNEENLIAMNMKYGTESVQYFYKQGKLTEEQFNQVSGVIKSLFKIINDSQKNYNTLN